MGTLTGRYGDIYLPTGTGTTTNCQPETVAFVSGVGFTTYRDIEISKITTDVEGTTLIHDWSYITIGRIYINSAPTGNRYVWYRYYTADSDLVEIGGFYEWSLDINYDIHDATHLTSTPATAKSYILGHHDWSGSASKYWIDSEVIQDYLETGDELDNAPFIIRLYAHDQTSQYMYWSGLCNITGMNPTVPTSGVITGTINFQGLSQNHCKLNLIDRNLLKNADFLLGSDSTATYWTKSGDAIWDSTNKRYVYPDSTHTGHMEQGYADFTKTASNSTLYRFQYDYKIVSDEPLTLKIKGGAGYFATTDITLPLIDGINHVFFISHSAASTSKFQVIATSDTGDVFYLDNFFLQKVVIY